MKNKTMSKKTTQFFIERNSSKSTQLGYNAAIKHFEKVTGKTLDEMIEIGKKERKLDWDETQIRNWLIIFRNYCYNNYNESSAKLYLARIRTIFHHFRIPLADLPYFSTKQTRKSEEIDYEDLPNREILKKCIGFKNPILKALTLFMSSTGISRTDTAELTIQDYLNATEEYHHTNDIHTAIEIMGKDQQIVPTFKLKRRKTGETYRTFASPESVNAINLYLLTRDDDLKLESKLFNINFRHINNIFKETNDKLGLGQINGRVRFCPQMLRSYHATQLSEAGMNDSYIDLIQGRKPQSIARKSYIRVKREKLKEEYIKCLPFLVVEDLEKVKTELEVTKEKNTELESIIHEKDVTLNKYEELFKDIDDRLNMLEEKKSSSFNVNAFDELL